MDSASAKTNVDLYRMKCALDLQKATIDRQSQKMKEMKVHFGVKNALMTRKMAAMSSHNKMVKEKLNSLEADYSAMKNQIMPLSGLQKEVNILMAEKESFGQLKNEMTEAIKCLTAAKQLNDRPNTTFALGYEDSQTHAVFVPQKQCEELADLSCVQSAEPCSETAHTSLTNILNEPTPVAEKNEILVLTNTPETITKVSEEQLLENHGVGVNVAPLEEKEENGQDTEFLVSEDVTCRQTSPGRVNDQVSVLQPMDVNDSRYHLIDQMVKIWPIKALKELCTIINCDELPQYSYTKNTDGKTECLVKCHLMGHTIGAQGPSVKLAKHRAATLMYSYFEAKRSQVIEPPEIDGTDTVLEKTSDLASSNGELTYRQDAYVQGQTSEAGNEVEIPECIALKEKQTTPSTLTEIRDKSEQESINFPGDVLEDVELLSNDGQTMHEDVISAEDSFRQLLSSTNPSVRKLKELDEDAIRGLEMDDLLELLEQIVEEEGLQLSFTVYVPNSGQDGGGRSYVRLSISPIGTATIGFGETVAEAQVETVFNCLLFFKNNMM